MKKAIFSIAVSALSILSIAALDIKTVDGEVYKNVTITNILPNAIDFTYTEKDGTIVLRGVKMTSLPADLQKKFNYSPEKAKAFEKQVEKYQAERTKLLAKHNEEYNALLKKQQEASKELDAIKAMLYAHRLKCWIHVIRPVGNQDCIARIDMPSFSDKFGQLGEVYIRHLTGTQNLRMGAVIYPTGKTISFEDGTFPVYDASMNEYALQLLGEREAGISDNSDTDAKPMYFPANAPKDASNKK